MAYHCKCTTLCYTSLQLWIIKITSRGHKYYKEWL